MIHEFAGCSLDRRCCELRMEGEPRHLEPQVYAVLCHLVENRDRVVSRDELLDHVWGHRFVTPATLNSRIQALRRALGDDGSTQRIVRTIRGRGFRFVAQVVDRESAGSKPSAVPDLSTNATPFGVSQPGQEIRIVEAPGGVRIARATSGRGPPLVKTANWLTHVELDWSSPVWRHWLTELSSNHTLVRYDERGCGLSDRDAEDLSFEAWVRDLEAIVDGLGMERVPLLGISQGCAVAVAFAARHPERVSSLVLYGGFVLGHFRRARDAAEMREAEMLIRELPLGWGRDNPAFRQFFANIYLPDGTPEQHRWFSELQRVTTSPENAVRLRTTAAEIDVREEARRVTAPTLVLHATGDAAIPFDQGRMLAACIQGTRFVPLESRNHILLESEPAWEQFLREVRPFLGTEVAVARPSA
jgi:DNA-binding winged helix-turn-helix (wHTH) protein/pimeloyl-ACP methyl ester carboxylesterase